MNGREALGEGGGEGEGMDDRDVSRKGKGLYRLEPQL